MNGTVGNGAMSGQSLAAIGNREMGSAGIALLLSVLVALALALLGRAILLRRSSVNPYA